MKRYLISALLIEALLCGSCTTYSYFNETFQEFPANDFPATGESIILVNNSIEQPDTLGAYIHYANGKIHPFSYAYDSLAVYMINSLGDRFIQNGSFSDVLLYNVPIRKDSRYKAAPVIDKEQRIQIEQESGAEWILSIDRIIHAVEIKENTLPELNVCTANLKTQITTLLRLYRNSSDSLYGNYIFNDTIHWDATQMTFREAIGQLPTINQCLKETIDELAYRIEERFLPVVREETRFFVVHSTPAMREAQNMIIQKDYDQAQSLWEYTYNRSKSTRIRQYAAYNLAVLAEKLSRYDDAINWINKAIQIDESSQIEDLILTDYKSVLLKRQNNYIHSKQNQLSDLS